MFLLYELCVHAVRVYVVMMGESRPLLKRSRVILHLRRTRSPRSRTIFTCFCLLLLFLGAVRNYAVENAFAERVRLLSYSYTWAQPYLNENRTKANARNLQTATVDNDSNRVNSADLQQHQQHQTMENTSSPSTTRHANATLLEIRNKNTYKGVRLPGMPFHSLPSRKMFLDDTSLNDDSAIVHDNDDQSNAYSNDVGDDTGGEENNQLDNGKLNKIEKNASEMNMKSITPTDEGPVNKNETSSVENVDEENEIQTNKSVSSNHPNLNKTQRDEMKKSLQRKSMDMAHSPKLRKTSVGNSITTAEEWEEDKYKSIEVETKQTRKVRKSLKSEPKPKTVEHPIHPIDEYDEEARAAITRNITRSTPIRQDSSTVFKFESCTVESLSQWQNKPLLQRKTEDSLRRLESVYITQYVEWHRSIIDDVKSGRVSGESVATLVYRGKEGVGDRIRGILHAFFCAMLTERVLLIDWVQPYALNLAIELGMRTNFTHDPYYFGTATALDHEIAPFGKHATMNDLKMLLVKEKKWLVMTKETRPNMKWLLLDVPFHYPKLKAVKKLGKLARHPWATEFFPLVFRALFKATSELRDRVEDFVTEGNDISERFIGIHVRLGGDTREEKSKRFKSDLTLQESATCAAQTALEMAKARGIWPPRFFLACDTVKFRSVLREAMKEEDSNAVLMFGEWKVKHVRHLNEEKDEDYDAFINTFLDLLILSHADSLLHMRSGFANLARWMGGIQPELIFHNTNCLVA